MAKDAARIRLDRHAGPDDRVRVSKPTDDAIGVEAVAVAEYLEEAPGRSSASLPPVKPFAASSAATTPFCEARPTCSGFVMLPKFTRIPEAMLAVMARACSMALASRPSSLADAAIDPNVPTVPDEWKPFL